MDGCNRLRGQVPFFPGETFYVVLEQLGEVHRDLDQIDDVLYDFEGAPNFRVTENRVLLLDPDTPGRRPICDIICPITHRELRDLAPSWHIQQRL